MTEPLEDIVARHPLPWLCQTTCGYCGIEYTVDGGTPAPLDADALADAAPAMALAIRALLRESNTAPADASNAAIAAWKFRLADAEAALRVALPPELRP